MTPTLRPAASIRPGDTLTDTEGLYTRTVHSVDAVSNRYGMLIIRTGRKGTGTTVVAPDTLLPTL